MRYPQGGGDSTIQNVTAVLYRDIVRTYFASGTITTFGNVELGTRIGAIWFLPAMFFAILIFQILLHYVQNEVDLALWSIGVALMGYISARFIWLPFSVQSGMFAVFFLWIGYEIRQKKWLEQLKLHHYIIAQLILLLGIFMGYSDVSFVVASTVDLTFSIVTGLSGCIVLYGLLCMAERIQKPGVLAWIGKNSLTVLCVHLYELETIGDIFYKASLRLAHIQPIQEVVCMLLHIAVAVGGAWLIETIKEIVRGASNAPHKLNAGNTGRDETIDIARGILMILMLLGHYSIDVGLRNVIYSFHMAAFVFLSGYFYRSTGRIGKKILHLMKTFGIPYLIYVVLGTGIKRMAGASWKSCVKTYFMGMSFSNRLFPQTESIGPMYFVLLLFLVRIVYMVIDTFCKSEPQKVGAVLICSAFGAKVGQFGFWMPWSADVACYAVAFYFAGILCAKYKIISKVRRSGLAYFVLSTMWAYLIYQGGMEIAVRNYGTMYSMTILGAVAGTLIVCRLSSYISENIRILAVILKQIGRASMTLLVIHSLWNVKIWMWLGKWFDQEHFANLVLGILIQLLAAVGISSVVCFWKKHLIQNGVKV